MKINIFFKLKSNIFVAYLLFFFIGLWVDFSYAKITWFLSREESPQKWAVIPTYRRTETLGHVVGGRIFVYPTKKTGSYFSFSSDWTPQQNNNLSFKTDVIQWRESGSEFSFQMVTGRFFDPYYELDSLSRIEIPIQNTWLRGHYLFPVSGPILIGGLLKFQLREELGYPCFLVQDNIKVKKSKACYAFSKKEAGGTAGLVIRSDTRDTIFNPSEGKLYNTELRVGYDFFQKGPLFFQFETKVKYIFSVLEDERWIFNFGLGGSFFKKNDKFPSLPYSYQFKLGGADYLRGYQFGRFHSDQYYLFQSELRLPLNRWVQPLIFIDIGEISFLEWPRWTYGLGFTLGLPHAYDKKIRFEIGWAADQKNFVVVFDRPY